MWQIGLNCFAKLLTLSVVEEIGVSGADFRS